MRGESERTLQVVEDTSIRRHEMASRLTNVERRLLTYLSRHQTLITCVGNIGAGKSSLVKLLAYSTGMNALFELPDEGFEDHIINNTSLSPLLGTAKNSARRALGRYYGAINDFIACQTATPRDKPAIESARRLLHQGALDIQHAYLDLRKMQLQAMPHLQASTCIDGSPLADRYAFCEVLHRDMDEPYLTPDALRIIDERLEEEFRPLVQPGLLVILKSPVENLLRNIRDRQRDEEGGAKDEVPEGLLRLVSALNPRYDNFVAKLRSSGWYRGPVLEIDVSQIDFVSNVRHMIAVYEGIEALLVPKEFRA